MNNRRAVLLAVLSSLAALLWMFVMLGTAAPQAGTYVVDDDADDPDAKPGDGLCETVYGLCTLRAAIEEANLDGVVSTIHFAGPMSISYPTLPPLTEQWTTIDASDQWNGAWPGGRPGVSIGGAGYWNGLLKIHAKAITVRGIEFSGSGSVGIRINGGDFSTIGGTEAGQRNVFLGGTGIEIDTQGVNHTVVGNYFGTWNGDAPVSSTTGVEIRADNNVIEGNLFGGHSYAAIRVWGGKNNQIRDNIIGANHVRNKPLPNNVGIVLESATGTVIGPYNFIAGNSSHGVEMRHSDENSFFGNRLGDNFTFGNGGDGLHVFVSHRNQIGISQGNVIARNGGNGVHIYGSGGNNIRGNAIIDSGKDGILVASGEENRIGGPDLQEKNSIEGSGANGIHLSSSSTISTVVSGNDIGLSSGAFDAGNAEHGILISGGSSGNLIGGAQAEGNRIGFNGGSGIFLTGKDTQNNVVSGNVLGAPVNWGWEAPNGNHGIAIYDGAHHNWIGWANTIVASSWSGVAIVNSHDNVVWFNRIGSDGADVTWGNKAYGVHVVNSPDNGILFNEIAYSGVTNNRAGVRVESGAATFNRINTNSIHDNGGPGIELRDGGNMGRGAPVISQASCQGPVSGTSCPGCLVEIFSDTAGEGKIFEAGVMADATSGAFTWNGAPNGPEVTATSTDGLGNTSPFSTAASVGSCNSAPTAAFDVTPPEGPHTVSFQFDASASSDAEDPDSALEVRWDWEDDGVFDTGWRTSKTAAHQFAAGALYTTRLEVRDSRGLIDAATKQVHVTELATPFQSFAPAIFR